MHVTQSALAELTFHDSQIVRVELGFGAGRARSATFDLHYYDWEGNAERRRADPKAAWAWRSMRIHFGYVAVFEYRADDLINGAHEIDTVTWGDRVEEIAERERALRERFSGYESPMLADADRVVSARFATQNWTDDAQGYFAIIGTDVTLSWDAFPAPSGQIHIPLA